MNATIRVVANPGVQMPLYDARTTVFVDDLTPDVLGCVRSPRSELLIQVELGQDVVLMCDDEMMFGRIARFEGGPVTGDVYIRVLFGRQATKAAKKLAVSWNDWCDLDDDEY